MSKYSELLKDFNWQAVRNKVIIRDGNKCTVCGSNKKLNVHHTFYYSDSPKPWLYPLSSLLTVCELCHLDYHLHHEIEIKKPKPKLHYGNVIKKDMSGMNYFEVECINKKGSYGTNSFWAKSKYDANIKMGKKGFKVISIKTIKKPIDKIYYEFEKLYK